MRMVITAIALAMLAGCSTVSETFGDGKHCGIHPYCGSAVDLMVIRGATEENAGVMVVLAPIAIIDLPFSLVADTLVLPYTLLHTDTVEP